MSDPLEGHVIGSEECKVGECYFRGWLGPGPSAQKCACDGCSGVLHVTATDWTDYSFGHEGGRPPSLKTLCDRCKKTGEIT